MEFEQIKKSFDRDPNCPSDAKLDLLFIDELDAQESQRLWAHLQSCVICDRRMEQRTKGFDSFEGIDPAVMEQRLNHGLNVSKRSEHKDEPLLWQRVPSSTWRITAWGLASLAAVCILGIFLFLQMRQSDEPSHGEPAYRIKGGLELTVFRLREGKFVQALPGEEFHPGDRIRFQLSIHHPGHARIIGVEQDGKLYPCAPVGPDQRSLVLAAGSHQWVHGMVELDNSLGNETFFLVWCPTPFFAHQIQWSNSDNALSVPESCLWRSFKMRKELP